jgi:predicted dehydrogenase
MKALVVGFGSIGRCHARLLGDLGVDVAVISRRKVDAPNVYPTIKDAVADWAPDYAVIASRTHEHRRDLAGLADAGFRGTGLIEKPLFDGGQDVPDHALKHLFIAYNLRFHPVLLRLRELLADAHVYAVHAYVGQYLPDWRPDADYRTGYSANKAEGGGVLRDLSHELDYLNWTLGGWTRLTATGGHVSNLEIDSDDIFSVLFETNRCPVVSVQMNYLDSTLRREVLALTDKGSIHADLAGNTIEASGETETFPGEGDDTYIAQHQAAMAGEDGVLCTMEQGLNVMRMIDAAETAAAGKIWVSA